MSHKLEARAAIHVYAELVWITVGRKRPQR